MNILKMFNRKKERYEVEFDRVDKPTGQVYGRSLYGFKDLEEIKYFHNAHKAYKWGELYVLAQRGATWRLYNKYGLPLTTGMHTLTLQTFGDLHGKLGASEHVFDMHEITEFDQGLRGMIKEMIKE